ncbi:MAG: hypothetical protein JRN06_02590 [Nitrososphaerota archaeon]|nr:hypothetical protein [Nitrososphaerota archaeon]MDG7023255.1 hypothetical protein [Nitrososphaerota archaeon]
MSSHKGGTKCPFHVTKAKLAYVQAVQGVPMACFHCGKKLKERDTAISRWTGRRTVYYHKGCASRLLIAVIT